MKNLNALKSVVLPVLGAALTIGASIVSAKQQDARLNDIVSKKVVEELSKNGTKES